MRTLILFIFCFCFLSTSGQNRILYQENSSGLGYPELEGGRTELEFADINLDGYLDLVFIGDHGSPYINTAQHGIMVWLGSATGSWTLQMTGNFGYGGIAVGDINNDGFPDVGYGMHHNYSSGDLGDQLIEAALGDGTGTSWVPWDDDLATAGETWGMFGTDFADVDNDGDLDLGCISFGSGSGVHVYLNKMDGTWEHSYGFLNGNSDMIFEFGDINRDGFCDFVASHEYGSVYFGDGTGNFTNNDTGLPSGGWAGGIGPSLGDVDNDGGKDLAYVNLNGGVEVYIWNEGTEQWVEFSGSLPASGDFELTQLRDMNSDGFMDVSACGGGTYTLWLGDGNANWTEEFVTTTPSPGYCQAFRAGGDIDHNGYPEFVIITEEGSWWDYQNHLHFYKETSSPVFLTVKPLFPKGGEVFYQQSVQFIKWISAVNTGEHSWIKLEYSTTGDSGPWAPISDSLPDNGLYQWLIPVENSIDCYLRHTVYSNNSSFSEVTPASFTITDGTVGIEKMEYDDEPGIHAWPNPFTDQINIRIENANPQDHICILDISGRKIKEFTVDKKGPAEISWNTNDSYGNEVPAGIYLCSYRSKRSNLTIKLIKK